jgi:hypothetical protein
MKKWKNEGLDESAGELSLALLLAEYRTSGQNQGRAVSLYDVKGAHLKRMSDLG